MCVDTFHALFDNNPDNIENKQKVAFLFGGGQICLMSSVKFESFSELGKAPGFIRFITESFCR